MVKRQRNVNVTNLSCTAYEEMSNDDFHALMKHEVQKFDKSGRTLVAKITRLLEEMKELQKKKAETRKNVVKVHKKGLESEEFYKTLKDRIRLETLEAKKIHETAQTLLSLSEITNTNTTKPKSNFEMIKNKHETPITRFIIDVKKYITEYVNHLTMCGMSEQLKELAIIAKAASNKTMQSTSEQRIRNEQNLITKNIEYNKQIAKKNNEIQMAMKELRKLRLDVNSAKKRKALLA